MEIDRIKTDTLPDDGGIVRLFEARDEEALRQTEKAHGALIRRVASRFLDDGRYYASCSVEEISRRLSLGRSTVEKDLKKTRDALKKQLEREGYEA